MKKKIAIFLCLLWICSSIRVPVSAGMDNDSNCNDSNWDYPIKPGPKEWASYNRAELAELLQIPEDILYQMSTEDLADIVLRYPYFSDIHFHNTYQAGFETLCSTFNGLREFVNREDAGTYLLSLWKSENQLTDSNQKMAVDQNKDVHINSFLAIMLAQDTVKMHLSDIELAELNAIMSKNRPNKASDIFRISIKIYYDVSEELNEI